jgi:hypothetical protein
MKRINLKLKQALAQQIYFEPLVMIHLFSLALAITNTSFFSTPNTPVCSEQPSKRRKIASAIDEDPPVDYNAVDFQHDFGAPTRKHQTISEQNYLD